MRYLCRWIARLSGWTFDDNRPADKRFVLIGYPHTSNWDFVLAMLFKFAVGFHFNWVAKHSLFTWPFGGLMRALGGIGVDRARTQGFIGQLVELFRSRDEMVLVITPEGTRGHTDYWRSGFYHLARSAEVPVVLGYVCFKTKRIGIGPTFHLSGDEEADLAQIRAFYADKVGRVPDHSGEIRFRPK
jgi:1-acyl-sn-glycerol-3-phosphate acyltransferase